MSFDFMKNVLHWEDEERFARLCENLEEVIQEARAEAGDNEITDLELMQALDFVGFNLCRDSWEEFKKMDFNRDFGSTSGSNSKEKNFLPYSTCIIFKISPSSFLVLRKFVELLDFFYQMMHFLVQICNVPSYFVDFLLFFRNVDRSALGQVRIDMLDHVMDFHALLR